MPIAVLATLALRVPLFLVLIAAVVLAAGRWERHRTVSLLVVSSVAVELFLSVVGTTVAMMLPLWMIRRGMASAQVGAVMSAVSLVESVIAAVGWGLLICAAFIDRRPPARSPGSAAPPAPATASR